MPDQLIYRIGLSLLPEIGSISAKKLVNHLGSAEQVFKESKKNLALIPGISKRMLEGLNKDVLIKAEKELHFIEQHNIRPLFFYGYRLSKPPEALCGRPRNSVFQRRC